MTRFTSGPTESWFWQDECIQVGVDFDNQLAGRALRNARTLKMLMTIVAAATSLVPAGCASETVVDTGEWSTITPAETVTTAQLPPVDPAHLVNAADYVAHPNYQEGATTSPRRAGVGIAGSSRGSGLGARRQTANWASRAHRPRCRTRPPNAIVIEPQGDARFVAADQPEFSLTTGPANVLPCNTTLVAAGFRCNIQ